MNERIRELAERANYLATEKEFPYDVDWFYLYNKKFAELIIRGCARKANAVALDLRNHPELDGRKYVGDSILKAFGVEQ